MNPIFSKEIAQEHIADLRRQARNSRLPEEFGELTEDDGFTVRAASRRDGEAVRMLAALEGVPMPSGPVLVAEVGDEVVAALPLDGGRPLADPFRPSAHFVELLEVRARQLRKQASDARHVSLIPRLRGVLRAA
jgi:hypothetical protein